MRGNIKKANVINKLLLLGKNGQVGWELQRTLAPLGQVIALERKQLDLTNEKNIRDIISKIKPDLIVNAAAYTDVEKAESDFNAAMAVNGQAPKILADEAKKVNALLMHFSTDYVFDGLKKLPYNEIDQPNPLNNYGKTKLAGEEAIISSGANFIILRLSWVYSTRAKNILLTFIKLASEKKEISVVQDQFGAPTWSRLIAEASGQLAYKILNNNHSKVFCNEIYHMSSAGKANWYDFAKHIYDRLASSGNFNYPQLKPILYKEYQSRVNRPLNSVLSNRKLNTNGLILPDWQEGLDLALQEL